MLLLQRKREVNFYFIFIDVQLIYNTVLVSGIQQNDLAMHIFIYIYIYAYIYIIIFFSIMGCSKILTIVFCGIQ